MCSISGQMRCRTWTRPGFALSVPHGHRTRERPALLEADGFDLAVVAFADHPFAYAATADRPGIAYADLRDGLPDWVTAFPEADVVLFTPRWGPNMTAELRAYARSAADALLPDGPDRWIEFLHLTGSDSADRVVLNDAT